eukprot:371936_1
MATDMEASDYLMLAGPSKSPKIKCMVTTLIVSLLVITSIIAGYFVYRNCTNEPPSSLSIPSITGNLASTLSPTLYPSLQPTTSPTASPTASPTDYDIYFANRLVKFCLISYCISDKGSGKVDTWDCSHCKKYYPQLTNVTVVETNWKDYDLNVFVVFDDQYYQYNGHKQPSIVIAFEGTNPISISNWIADLNLFVKEYDHCDNCFVHQGFYDAYSIASKEIWTAVTYYRNMFGEDIPVQVTGHSLGAALAVFCALDGAVRYGIESQLVYTFGQPRVGNQAFAKYYNAKIPLHYRVTHSRDPVPHLPSGWMATQSKYWHVATEIFYKTNSNGSYVTCDGSGEDAKCSNMFNLNINVLSHLDYMGYNFATNFLTCGEPFELSLLER